MVSQAQGVFQGQHRVSQGASMMEMTVINGAGERKTITAGSEESKAWVHAMGDLGVIIDATYSIVPDTLMFCTIHCSNVNPDVDFDSSGMGEEFTAEVLAGGLDLDFLYQASPMMGPAVTVTRMDERTTDMDTRGMDVQDAPSAGAVFQVYKCRDRHLAFFDVVDQVLAAIFKTNPDIETKFWTYIHGSAYPAEPVQIVRKATFENVHDFSGVTWDGETMFLFGSVYEHVEYGKMMYKEMLRTRRCVPGIRIEVGIVGRSFNDPLPTYLGHQYHSVELFWVTFAPRAVFEEYQMKFICLLRCTHGLNEIEFHLGEMTSRDLYKLAGNDWVTAEHVQKFKAIEAKEDPNHKFTTAFTYEIGKRLEPQEDVCSFCARQTFC